MPSAAAGAAAGAAASAAAALLLAALVLNEGSAPMQLLGGRSAAGCSLASTPCSAQGAASTPSSALGAADTPLTFGADGSISADTARKWRKEVESDGAFPVPDRSFFDSTNSDVWDVGNTQGKETSWLKPGKWVADRRGSGTEQRDRFAADAHSEYQDGQWWPYQLGVGPSTEAKRVKEAEDTKHGAANSWQDLYKAMVRRYDNPTGDPYMEQEYKRLVVAPSKAVMRAHSQGLPSPPASAGLAGQVETAQDAVQKLDREADLALPALDKLFGDIGTLNKGRGLPGTAAWPEKFPADGGISAGVFRKFDPHAASYGGAEEPRSWEEVAAANVDPSLPLALPRDGLTPKEAKSPDWPYTSPESPLGYLGTTAHAFDRNFVQDPSSNFIADWRSGGA